MNIGENIKKRRLELGISVDELAEKIGKNRATIYRYENSSIENLPTTILEPLAKALYTTPAKLMGWSNVKDVEIEKEEKEKSKGIKIGVLGRVPAGVPIEAVEDIIDYEEISEEMANNGEYFALKIQGDSMYPRILDGDVVIVRKQTCANNGDVVIVLVNGNEGTCKQFYKYDDHIELKSFNPMFQPMKFNKEEVDDLPVQIIGKVVELRGKF